MSKKLNLSKIFYIGDALRIWINLGWYWGEEFKLLELTLLMCAMSLMDMNSLPCFKSRLRSLSSDSDMRCRNEKDI